MPMTGIHGTNLIDCFKVPVKIRSAYEISDTIKLIASSYEDLVVVAAVYIVIELSTRYPHFLCIRLKKMTLNT